VSYKTSYSQNSLYNECSKAWWWKYVQKLESPEEGASLFFGSAIDTAIMALLEKDPNYEQLFLKNMQKQFAYGKATQIFDNDDIVYSYSDFDADILTPQDFSQLEIWAKDLGFISQTYTPNNDELINVYKACVALKKNPYKAFKPENKTFFNRASWLSLQRKGLLLIESFKKDFYPKITKVLATQQRASITDPNTGDSIVGIIDMVLEIEGYNKPIIFDLKTAARPYTEDQIDLTTQLTLYAGMQGNNYNTDLVGYVVLCKNINKDKVSTCKNCGNLKSSRHKTCDKDINGSRCNGDWDEKIVPNPQVQVLIREKTQQQINDLFLDIGNIILAMKQKIVYKNTSKCTNWYGGTCAYYNACHKNDLSGLVKK
jgi:hypothetical protein